MSLRDRAKSARPPGAQPREEMIHRAVVELLQASARPGVAWTHMPAGELRAPATAGKLKGLGTKPGWPDLQLIRDGRFYGLELKREGGKVSPAQIGAHQELRAAGATIAVAYGLDAAIAVLRQWEMVR